MTKKKRNNTLIYVLGGAVVLLIALAVWKGKSRPEGEKVSVETAEARTIRETVAASGKVFPVTEVKISSDVSGEIVELYVEEGDSVVAGQILAKIDPDAYQSQVERGMASVNSAKAQQANSKAQNENLTAQKEQIQAQLANTRDIHRRNEQLHKEGVISDADFETSKANLEGLEANLRSAEASIRAAKQSAEAARYSVESSEATLKELRTSLRRTTIYSPVSGIVSKLNVEKGERVVGTIQMTGTEMMRIANLNAMEVQVEVSENDIPRVAVGDVVDIEVDAYVDRNFKGRVSQIANSANTTGSVTSLTTDQVTNFVVTIDIDPASYADLVSPAKPYPFRPGMSASVEINTETVEEALSIPIQAVTTREIEEEDKDKDKDKDAAEARQVRNESGTGGFDDQVKEVVFVVESDTVRLVEVRTGIQDDTYIQVLEGLSVGDRVVTGPYATVSRKLEEGQTVRVVEEEELYTGND